MWVKLSASEARRIGRCFSGAPNFSVLHPDQRVRQPRTNQGVREVFVHDVILLRFQRAVGAR